MLWRYSRWWPRIDDDPVVTGMVLLQIVGMAAALLIVRIAIRRGRSRTEPRSLEGEAAISIEVENAIGSHPAVAEVAVIGIPSDKWGEAVHAIVVLRQGAKATGEELIAHARKVLAGFKVPKSIEFRDDPLPLSGAFKPLKRELRRYYWENQERRVS